MLNHYNVTLITQISCKIIFSQLLCTVFFIYLMNYLTLLVFVEGRLQQFLIIMSEIIVNRDEYEKN